MDKWIISMLNLWNINLTIAESSIKLRQNDVLRLRGRHCRGLDEDLARQCHISMQDALSIIEEEQLRVNPITTTLIIFMRKRNLENLTTPSLFQ